MSFAYVATFGGKESFQSFKIAVAMFSEGSVVGIRIIIWYVFRHIFAIIGLRTSSGLKLRRLVKRIILRDGRKNP